MLLPVSNHSGTSKSQYLDNGWLQKQTLVNGANASWTYNARGFVTRLQNLTSSSATLSDFGGTGGILSDSLGNPTSLPANVPGSTAASGTTTYTYNTQDELTQEQSARNGSYTNSFGYDPAFNPTTWKGSAQTFNSDNQNSAFVFDGNGSPTSYKGNTLSFDPENRLTAYGSLLTAGYNGDDLRAWKQNGSGRTYFLYDGADPVVEMDASGNVTAVNTFGAAGLVSRHASTGSTFYTFDTQGSTVERLDSNQNVLSTDVFDAFGKLLSGPASDPWGYEAQDGYFTDAETGLIALSYRYYDPSPGRFLNRDPIGFGGGINLYGYVANAPLALSDPSGMGADGDPEPPIEDPDPATAVIEWNKAHGNSVDITDYRAQADEEQAAKEIGAFFRKAGGRISDKLRAFGNWLQQGDDLSGDMASSGLTPTQKTVSAKKVNEIACLLDEADDDFWKHDYVRDPLTLDPDGNIVNGHHRFIASQISGVRIPDWAVRRLTGPTARAPRPWSQVIVEK